MTDYAPNAILTSREDINDELAVFRVRSESGAPLLYVPGQYAELALPVPEGSTEKPERRSYSIASAPKNGGDLEFYIVRVNGGYLTPRLWDMRPGDRIWLGPKIKGKFTLDETPAGADLIMIATGTGLAPFLSMLREHREDPRWRNVALIHGARFERDLGYRAELERYQAEHPWFHYIPSLTRDLENETWTGPRGRVQSLFTSGLVESKIGALTKESSHFLLCGNPQMIDDVQALLEGRGFAIHKKKAPGNIHVERYW
ncbi:MAG: ferredoxin--NADP reductase [Bdellovibrionota bacterium]